MSVGKYSPTVSHSYRVDQKWFEKNGGGLGCGTNPDSDADDDGYDSYGYSGDGNGPDRAGNTEMQYLTGTTYDDGEPSNYLYDSVTEDWYGVYIPDHKWPVTLVQMATKVINGGGFADLDEQGQKICGSLAADPLLRDLLAKAYSHGAIRV